MDRNFLLMQCDKLLFFANQYRFQGPYRAEALSIGCKCVMYTRMPHKRPVAAWGTDCLWGMWSLGHGRVARMPAGLLCALTSQ